MALNSIGEYVAAIEEAGELVRIRQPVSVKLEMCEIADRVMKRPGGGPALLFEHPLLDDGSRSVFPVAVNLFGSMSRMALALGARDLDEPGRRIDELLQMTKVPDGLMGKLALLPRLLEVAKFPPRAHRGGAPPCQEVVWQGTQIDLRKLPVMTTWPEAEARR